MKKISPLPTPKLEESFARLVYQWKKETRGVSSSTSIALHPAYQQIIAMGEPCIPLLLRELSRGSGRWFWALESITGENPVPPEFQGKTKYMVRFWLDWGKEKGYISR